MSLFTSSNPHFERKRQRTGAVQKLALARSSYEFAERFGLRQSSGAFECVAAMAKDNKIGSSPPPQSPKGELLPSRRLHDFVFKPSLRDKLSYAQRQRSRLRSLERGRMLCHLLAINDRFTTRRDRVRIIERD